MSYTHLTLIERTKIEVYLSLGYYIRHITRLLDRHPSSISREIKRLSHYEAHTAQAHYRRNKTACGAHTKLTYQRKQLIESALDKTWSPEQLIEKYLKGIVSVKSIYRWLYQGQIARPLTVLRHKGKRQAPHETRGRFNIGTPISQRPKAVKQRLTFGHWELDTVVSGRGKAKGCLATFVELQTRWYHAILMPNRTAASMEQAIRTLYEQYGGKVFKRFTTDRGKEFSCF